MRQPGRQLRVPYRHQTDRIIANSILNGVRGWTACGLLAGISTISPAVKRAGGTITLFTFDEASH
jgi:hypothetical protein